MAKKRGRAKPPLPAPDPESLGEAWRSQMTEDCEGLPSLIWRRVHRRFSLDLSDPRQASAEQVYRLLVPLAGYERVTREMLAELIDRAVPGVFPELAKRKRG